MLACFEQMDPRWFHRAFVYTGSVTDREKNIDFRYRYEQDEREDGTVVLKAQTYSSLCYEKAEDVEEQVFPWTDGGVEALKAWYQSQYEKYVATHTEDR